MTSAGFHTVLSAPFYLNYISYGTLSLALLQTFFPIL